MATSLGDRTRTKILTAEQLGTPSNHVAVAYIDSIIPSPVAPTESLQNTLTAGNEANLDIKLDGTAASYKLTDATYTTVGGEIGIVVSGANGNDLQLSCKEDGGVLNNVLTCKEDKTLYMPSNIIIKSGGDGDIQIGKDSAGVAVGDESVNIGEDAGTGGHASVRAVNIGFNAGKINCGSRSVQIGDECGEFNTGSFSVSIGTGANENGTGADVVAIGREAGTTSTLAGATLLGSGAGRTLAGTNSVAIGHEAGRNRLGDGCIVLNGTGAALDTPPLATNGFYVAPIVNAKANQDQFVLSYNTADSSITHDYFRLSVTELSAAAGGTYSMGLADSTVITTRWTPGLGTFTITLPQILTMQTGRRFYIKNNSITPNQIVRVSPFVGDRIDGTADPIDLNTAARTPSGGGGSAVEVVEISTGWIVISNYNHLTY